MIINDSVFSDVLNYPQNIRLRKFMIDNFLQYFNNSITLEMAEKNSVLNTTVTNVWNNTTSQYLSKILTSQIKIYFKYEYFEAFEILKFMFLPYEWHIRAKPIEVTRNTHCIFWFLTILSIRWKTEYIFVS